MKQAGVLQNVQALRAIAAFMVVLYHARLMTPIGGLVSFDFGNAGVDVFFFISGFIIAHVSRRDDVGAPGHFLLKRAIRILPLYWLLSVMLFAVAQVKPDLAGAGGRPDALMLVKSLLFIPYYDGSGEMHPVLFMGWTLDYEVLFYAVFAVALLIRAELARLLCVSGVLAVLVLTGFAVAPTDAIGSTYTSPLMLEFVIGMWLNLVFRRLPEGRIGDAAGILVALSGLAAFVLLVAGGHYWPGVAREIKWGGPALGIVIAALLLQRGGRTIGWGWLLLLGEASYAVYLVHPFVIKAASIVYAKLGINALPVHAAALIGLYVLVAVIGIAFHILVERPAIRWLRHRLLPRDPPSVAAPAN